MAANEDSNSKMTIVKILKCKNPECKAWVREEFASPGQTCPMCSGPMLRTMKHLPPLVKKIKSAKR